MAHLHNRDRPARCNTIFRQGRCPDGKTCPNYEKGHFKSYCRSFVNHGYCRFGQDRCNFSHDRRLRPCSDLLETGACRVGDECAMSHYPKICGNMIHGSPCNPWCQQTKSHRPIHSPAVVDIPHMACFDRSWTASCLVIHRRLATPIEAQEPAQQEGEKQAEHERPEGEEGGYVQQEQEGVQDHLQTCFLMIYQKTDLLEGLNFPGGRRDWDPHYWKNPSSERTFREHCSKACTAREFVEKTAGLLSEEQVLDLLQGQPRCVLVDTMRSYFVSPSREVLPDDVELMNEHLEQTVQSAEGGQQQLDEVVATSFHWVPALQLLDRKPQDLEVKTLNGDTLKLARHIDEFLYWYLDWKAAMVQVLTEAEKEQLELSPLKDEPWNDQSQHEEPLYKALGRVKLEY